MGADFYTVSQLFEREEAAAVERPAGVFLQTIAPLLQQLVVVSLLSSKMYLEVDL